MAESRMFDGSNWITVTDEEHRTAGDPHTQYALADGTRGMFAATSHTHAASQISDSTATGRALITAATATAARTAISAAPALGSDDNYVTDAEKAALHTHPAVIAQGATAADARAAIDAGTSSLALGSTATDAAPGNHDHDSRYIRTVNGTGPDGSGNVAVAGGGGAGAPARASMSLSGRKLAPPGSTNGVNGAAGMGKAVWWPIIAWPAPTINAVWQYVWTATEGGIMRVGLYNADANMKPTTLIADLGTISAAATGAKLLSFTTMTMPSQFMVCVWTNSDETVRWTKYSWAGDLYGYTGIQPVGGGYAYGGVYYGPAVDYSAGLPETAPATGTDPATNWPAIWVNVA